MRRQSQPPSALYHAALAVARHEAGHYIVAKAQGFLVAELYLELLQHNGHRAGSSICLAESLPTAAEACRYLRRRILVLYAGILAESMTGGKVNHQLAVDLSKKGGAQDVAKVRELIHLLRNLENARSFCESELQAQLDALEQELWECATQCVEQEAHVIEGLAQRLASEVKTLSTVYRLSGEEISTLPAIAKRFPDLRSEVVAIDTADR